MVYNPCALDRQITATSFITETAAAIHVQSSSSGSIIVSRNSHSSRPYLEQPSQISLSFTSQQTREATVASPPPAYEIASSEKPSESDSESDEGCERLQLGQSQRAS
jgi:hypothetical protein